MALVFPAACNQLLCRAVSRLASNCQRTQQPSPFEQSPIECDQLVVPNLVLPPATYTRSCPIPRYLPPGMDGRNRVVPMLRLLVVVSSSVQRNILREPSTLDLYRRTSPVPPPTETSSFLYHRVIISFFSLFFHSSLFSLLSSFRYHIFFFSSLLPLLFWGGYYLIGFCFFLNLDLNLPRPTG